MVEEQTQPQPQEGEGGEEEVVPKKKIDVKAALKVIPPASQLFGERRRVPERRVRLRFKDNVKEGIAVLNPQLAQELGVKEGDQVAIVVAHRHRFVYRVAVSDEVPPTEVWVNEDELPEHGVADNSIATIRPVRQQSSQ